MKPFASAACVLVVATLFVLAGRAEPAAPAAAQSPAPVVKSAVETKMPQFRVDASGFQAGEADIRAVCDSAGRELWRHFPDYPLESIVVTKGNEPITLFQRNAQREIVMMLNTGGMKWSQYAYQFAHEFCHVLCGAKRGDKSNQWFEETLCELASIYALRGMANTWNTNPPYPNWRDYRDSLRSYADNTMRRWPHTDEIVRLGLPQWYEQNESKLRKNSIDRDMNGSIAVLLLPMFERQPEHWEAVRWLNTKRTDAVRTFDAYLADWHESVPEKHKPFVAKIAEFFGKKIKVAKKAAA